MQYEPNLIEYHVEFLLLHEEKKTRIESPINAIADANLLCISIVPVRNRLILNFRSLAYKRNQVAKNGIFRLIERVFDDYNLCQQEPIVQVYNNENEMYTSNFTKKRIKNKNKKFLSNLSM